MQATPHLLERSLRWLGALLAALCIAACGPGTGGTGTGPGPIDAPTPPVASYSAVYALPAPASEPSPGPEPSPKPPPGQVNNGEPPGGLCAQPEVSKAAAGDGVTLALQAESIQLTTPCATFTYAGPWSPSDTGQVVVQGNWESPATLGAQPATLSLSFGESGLDSATLSFTVTDSAGVVLWGPVTLQRVPPTPPS